MTFEPAGLRTGEVAERAGVNSQTLRYYERRGLLAEPDRSNGGHRLYPPDTVALLSVIKAAQRLGFTLDEVAGLLDTGRRRHRSPDLRQRALDKITEIDRRIADLTAVRDTLAQVADARCDNLTECTCPDCPLPALAEARLPPAPRERSVPLREAGGRRGPRQPGPPSAGAAIPVVRREGQPADRP